MPRDVTAGVPRRIPLGLKGLRGSYGTVLELQMIPARSRACAAFLPMIFLLVKSIRIK